MVGKKDVKYFWYIKFEHINLKIHDGCEWMWLWNHRWRHQKFLLRLRLILKSNCSTKKVRRLLHKLERGFTFIIHCYTNSLNIFRDWVTSVIRPAVTEWSITRSDTLRDRKGSAIIASKSYKIMISKIKWKSSCNLGNQ